MRPSRLPESLIALRYRDFRLLTVGLSAAITGWWMIIIAQGWLVLEMTDSAAWVATASAALSLPFLVLGPFSGVVADRWYRKTLLVTTRMTIATVMLIEGLLIIAGLIELWQILLLGTLAGCAFAMDIPARQSLIPDVVPEEAVPNAVAIGVSVTSLASVAGPIAGAAMLALVGAGGCFVANALGNLVLALAILAMHIPRRNPTGDWDIFGDLANGFRFVANSNVVSLLLLMALVTMIGTSAWRELAPVFVRDVFGSNEAGLGALHTAAGIGAVLAAGLLLWSATQEHRRVLYVMAAAISVLSVLGFVTSSVIQFGIVFALINGFARQLTDAVGQTVLLLKTPEQFRGRVMSLWALLWGMQPMGTFTAGMASEVVGPRIAVGGLALVAGVVLLGVGLAKRSAWREF